MKSFSSFSKEGSSNPSKIQSFTSFSEKGNLNLSNTKGNLEKFEQRKKNQGGNKSKSKKAKFLNDVLTIRREEGRGKREEGRGNLCFFPQKPINRDKPNSLPDLGKQIQ